MTDDDASESDEGPDPIVAQPPEVEAFPPLAPEALPSAPEVEIFPPFQAAPPEETAIDSRPQGTLLVQKPEDKPAQNSWWNW